MKTDEASVPDIQSPAIAENRARQDPATPPLPPGSLGLLLEFHKLQVARSEHYEDQRSSMSTLVLTVAAALIGLATYDQALSPTDAISGFLVALVGVLGLVGSRLHYHRSLRHGVRASAYRDAMSQGFSEAAIITAIQRRVDADHASRGRKGDLRLHHVWSALHVGLILVGAALVIFSLS